MKKFLLFTLFLTLYIAYTGLAQNKANEPVLNIAQKKDSSRIVNPDQEINTKIPRLTNCSQTSGMNNAVNNNTQAAVAGKKQKTGKKNNKNK